MRPLALLLVFILPAASVRAADDPIAIRSVHFGFTPKPGEQGNRSMFKAAKWMPVQVTVEAVGSIEDKSIEITAAVPDGDDLISQATITVPAPSSGPALHILYLKPGGVTAEVTVSVRGADSGRQLAAPVSRRLIGLPPSRHLILSVGSNLDGFRIPRTEGQQSESTGEQDSWRNGWVQHGRLTDPAQLPYRWFGYEGVDLLVLTGDQEDFWKKAVPEQLEAVAEWVRRGGRVLIGGKAFLFADGGIFRGLQDRLPFGADVGNLRLVNEIPMVLPNQPRTVLRSDPGTKITLLAIEQRGTGQWTTRLLADERESAPPLVVQASFGLGRLTMVTFDLDKRPFSDWSYRETFWEWLLTQTGTRLPTGNEPITLDTATEDEDTYLARQLTDLETYEGIPVVSFGWVALLLLGYILLIGPFEYLLLKKIFKRLEWTWLTFPIIVATTCVLAYIAAVEIKGRDLKLNKIDLVEIDVEGKRVYGQSWFGIYSPRGQSYTVAAEPTWEPTSAADRLVSWHGKPRNTRQSLFRRSYRYHVGDGAYADGLEEVPIQVWSTKAFTSRWAAAMETPLIESTLRRAAADPNQLTGSITSRLPVDVIEDAKLLYRGRVINVPALIPGVPRYVFSTPQAASAVSWLQSEIPQRDLFTTNRGQAADTIKTDENPRFRLWPMLFHDEVQGQFNRLANASFRELDQSWRIDEKSPDQAILVMRLRREDGPAEEMSKPERAPTRLWLNAIPGHGERQPIAGTLRQETYIRVYLPVPMTVP